MTLNAPAGTRLDASGWREFFDVLSDAVIVFDATAHVVIANTAALRLLPCEAGMSLDQLQATLGTTAVRWLRRAVALGHGQAPVPAVRLADGRSATVFWRQLDRAHSALHLRPEAERARPLPAPDTAFAVGTLDGMREAISVFWESPFPAMLQGADFRVIDVNQAFADFIGMTREQLIGTDPIALRPEEDRAEAYALRERAAAGWRQIDLRSLTDALLIDGHGLERWVRSTIRVLQDANGQPLYLAVMQDSTAEHVARERADRSVRELDDWFDLNPVGMVLFDDSGLLVRTNPAFDALAGAVPVSLADAPASLQQLLAWRNGHVLPALQPGSNAVQSEGWVGQGGELRRLRSILRSYQSAGGQRRYMAVVEDRSIEEERDLAQIQIGAMMDTAGVGVATFQESSGWVRQRHTGGGEGSAAAALQSISREIVLPESLPEYEKLQTALRLAQRAEVRYAIRHPELGPRWLLTRVEPATLASGKRTTSVVTLDVTEQHRTEQRSEQLLREMTTILESTTAGIAYLRGSVLVRCNRRFETMLGLRAGAVAGSSVQELFGQHAHADRLAADTWAALAEGAIYETEFDMQRRASTGEIEETRWYSLSVRGTGQASEAREAIAVLSDVTRLKTQQMELELLARDRELMFSLSEVGISFVRGGTILRANEAFAQLMGYTPQELVRLELAELFVDAADYQQRWPLEEAGLRHHGRWSGERRMRRRDGRLVWMQVSKRLVSDGDPAAGFIASYVDVDARHRAEQAVAEQAERTRSILNSVLVGIVTVGPGGIEWMNRSAGRMFAGGLADFANLPMSTVATPEADHPFRQTQYLDELAEGQAETFECRVKARDGREFWIVGNAVVTGRGPGGRQLTFALLDIERRRQAEARMSEAQASLQRIIEAAPLAITLRDAQTLKVVQINAVAARSLRRTPEELIGLAPEEIFKPELAASRRADMQAALAAPDVTTLEYRSVIGGEPMVWDVRYLPLASGQGQPPDQLLLVATDVTEQRAAQEARFAAALAQREMLVREVHHRIKNNLQGVAGLLQQVAQRRPEVAGVISEVVSQVHAIAQVYGLQVGISGPLRLLRVVEAITGSVQRTFSRAIRFEVLGAAPERWTLPEAESIPIALTLNELLTNAIKHSAASSGEVSCTLVCGEAGVQVAVSNPAQLPAGFSLAGIPGGVSGLGLVRALLPRRSASLTIEQLGTNVVATVALQPPGVGQL